MSETNPDDLAAADAFRNTLLDRADARNPFPLWHGWAIVDAYLAGVKAERERAEAELERLRAEVSELEADAEERDQYAMERNLQDIP